MTRYIIKRLRTPMVHFLPESDNCVYEKTPNRTYYALIPITRTT